MSVELKLNITSFSQIHKLAKSLNDLLTVEKCETFVSNIIKNLIENENSFYKLDSEEVKVILKHCRKTEALKLLPLLFKWCKLNAELINFKYFPWELINIDDYVNHIQRIIEIKNENSVDFAVKKEEIDSSNCETEIGNDEEQGSVISETINLKNDKGESHCENRTFEWVKQHLVKIEKPSNNNSSKYTSSSSSSKSFDLSQNSLESMEINSRKISKNVKNSVKSNKFKIFNTELHVDSHIEGAHKTETSKDTNNAAVKELPAIILNHKQRKDRPKTDCQFSSVKKNGVQKFRCNICKKLISTKQLTKRHIRTVHNKEERYSCNICEAKFKYDNSLVRHIQSVHESFGKYKCDICEKIFATEEYKKRHMKRCNESNHDWSSSSIESSSDENI
ncbi:zinc finger protein 501-like protein [Leptotrombidium deliense]|uniref:Zinc finger protein 501-like protein n=1 Tax=Leptotrombidium deliense TaxID=299467 RepID=A0A443S1Y8_9ACAR|nr:zinc finger protein 501-like protein [Leptotrombidium deliense]